MRQAQVVSFLLAVLCGLSLENLSAQTPLLPSAVGVDLGMGPSFPRAVDPPCHDGRPAVGGIRLGWTVHRLVQFQATASTFGNVAVASCGDIVPCLRDQPCPREEGIGKDLKPVGVGLLVEPMGREARWSPRFTVGAGRLIGDGESYALIGAGLRYGDRSGLSLTVDLDRFFFRAPIEVFDHWTNELLSSSRDAVTLSLVRIGLEWGS